ncbi:MAG: hypothetical protein AAF598_22520 [Bacteroidota bacterium]
MDNQRGNALVAVFFLILPLSVAMGVTGMFGGALSMYFPEINYWKGFWYFNLIAGTGWLLQLVLAVVLLRGDLRADYIGYLLTVVMSIGLLILVPYIIASFFIQDLPYWIPIVFIVFSFMVMLYRHLIKVAFLELSQWWTLSWVLLLWIPSTLLIGLLIY